MSNKQEPYFGINEAKTPSWMSKKRKPVTFWTITWAVCTGILFANTIEALTAALTFYINMHVYVEPAFKKLFE